MMRKLHESAMSSAMNIVGESGVVRPAPDPQATWTRRQCYTVPRDSRPTPP